MDAIFQCTIHHGVTNERSENSYISIVFWNLGYKVKRMALKELFLGTQIPHMKNHSFSQNDMIIFKLIPGKKKSIKYLKEYS